MESLSSSERDDASIATGSSAVGIVQGLSTRGWSGLDSVSPVSARLSRPIEAMSPATTRAAGTWCWPKGWARAPIRSSSSWSSWPASSAKKAEKWPETCTDASGTRVPEKTRTMLTRPTYWSLLVRTTSATSGASGSQVTVPAPAPLGLKDSWAGCSAGDGKPRTHRSRSSAHPRPSVAHTASTG